MKLIIHSKEDSKKIEKNGYAILGKKSTYGMDINEDTVEIIELAEDDNFYYLKLGGTKK